MKALAFLFIASQALAQMPQMPGVPPLPYPELPEAKIVPLPPPWWIMWAAGTAAFILLALIIWLLLRPKPLAVIIPRKPHASCLRALADLRARVTQIEPSEISHRVSLILRRYLAECHAVPALTRTTPELFSGLRNFASDQPIPLAEGVWRERFAPVARWCDELSFMPSPATSEQSLSLIDQAIAKVEEERP